MTDIKIPINTVKDDFNSFLNIERNSRVFFSGKFGIGKTYFLKDFFDSHPDQYEVFHLYPVSYQINSNEDIIELLKYDILIELLKKNKNIFETKAVNGIKESSLLFYSWCKENYSFNKLLRSVISVGEISSSLSLNPIITFLGKLGRPLKDILKIDEEFQKFKEEYKNGEKGLIEKYSEGIKSKVISETDYISHLLKEKILQQKVTKKSVLILDDLDRIDPEHIFRILNILSAYFEKEDENKFGFDLIIIAADYSNLKHIFHHKYGGKADFSGYLDKFFTISPYYFDNKKAIIDTVDEIAKSIRNEEPNLDGAIGESGYIKLFLSHIFAKAVDSEVVNLRELLKATRFRLLELKKGSFYQDPFEDNFSKLFNKAVKIAILSFSNTDNFIEKIEAIKQSRMKAERRMPFGKYIETMLKSFDKGIPKEKSDYITWGDFKIRGSSNGLDPISVDDNRDEALFYDLLIEYVKNRKHFREDYSH
ncbi:MAG: P-loop NTPase fold protein [Candidatus ainarchaeum sp.]|nr:P-loop NTPase fold protein [Candidatus ainarchaeum sp.]